MVFAARNLYWARGFPRLLDSARVEKTPALQCSLEGREKIPHLKQPEPGSGSKAWLPSGFCTKIAESYGCNATAVNGWNQCNLFWSIPSLSKPSSYPQTCESMHGGWQKSKKRTSPNQRSPERVTGGCVDMKTQKSLMHPTLCLGAADTSEGKVQALPALHGKNGPTLAVFKQDRSKPLIIPIFHTFE